MNVFLNLALFVGVVILTASTIAVAQGDDGSSSTSTESTTTPTTTTTTRTTTTTTATPTRSTRSSTTRPSTTTTEPPPMISGNSRFGSVSGLRYRFGDSDFVDAYLGVRYAKKPNRFTAAELYENANDNVQATTLPPACYQSLPTDETNRKLHARLYTPAGKMDEDCLFLNIWSPRKADGVEPKAVMVFIHGGGWHSGTSSLDAYNGTVLAFNGDVVVVTFNYRLGPLGFLSMNDDSARGNYGLLDQQLALRWVQNNIGAFRGDPNKVTLFGQSSGGASITYHLVSGSSKSLFRSGIIGSNFATGPYMFQAQDEAASYAKQLAEKLGCEAVSTGRRNTVTTTDVVNCLREKSVEDVVNTQWQLPANVPFKPRFAPTVDGTLVTDTPLNLLKSGALQYKNVTLGVDSDEGSFFLYLGFTSLFNLSGNNVQHAVSSQEFVDTIKKLNNLNDNQFAAITFEYSINCDGTQQLDLFDGLDNMVGDWQAVCPAVNFSQTLAGRNANYSVYMYEFTQRNPLSPLPVGAGNAIHGFEIDYIFGQPIDGIWKANFTDDDVVLSRSIVSYWSNFAKYGSPKGPDDTSELADWPKYTTAERKVLILNTVSPLMTTDNLRNRQCDFWNSLIPALDPKELTTSHGLRAVGSSTAVLLFAMFSLCFRLVTV